MHHRDERREDSGGPSGESPLAGELSGGASQQVRALPEASPVAGDLPRANVLATLSIASAAIGAVICLPIGATTFAAPLSVTALLMAAVALWQIRSRGGLSAGAGRAWAALVVGGICLVCIAIEARAHARHEALVLSEAARFFGNFSRYQEDEAFGAAARQQMSRGLRSALKEPEDARLSFEIADALGTFGSFQSCARGISWARKSRLSIAVAPQLADLRCQASFAPAGPPISALFTLVYEENAWRMARFSLKSPLRARAFAAQGALPANLPDRVFLDPSFFSDGAARAGPGHW